MNRNAIVGLSTLMSIAALAAATPALAKNIRVDDPGAVGCQLTNWTAGTPSGGAQVQPGDPSLDSVVFCSPTAGSNASLDPSNPNVLSSIFETNAKNDAMSVPPSTSLSPNSAYVAGNALTLATTQSYMYEFIYSGSGGSDLHSLNSPNGMDAQIFFWSLTNGDTEVEILTNGVSGASGLSSWCLGEPNSPSFKLGNSTYSGGCNSAGGDLLFDANKKLLTTDTSGWTITPMGGTVSAPEMDPSTASAGLTMLIGAITVIRGRRRTR